MRYIDQLNTISCSLISPYIRDVRAPRKMNIAPIEALTVRWLILHSVLIYVIEQSRAGVIPSVHRHLKCNHLRKIVVHKSSAVRVLDEHLEPRWKFSWWILWSIN